MRRLLAMSLLLLFGLPFALPLFGSSAAEASLPACCRRGGKHHCTMIGMLSSGSSTNSVSEKCPYSIAQPAILVLPSFTPSTSASIFAGVTPHPAIAPQVEAWLRISFDRARQKRGPPARTA